jgi:hypothetical protein
LGVAIDPRGHRQQTNTQILPAYTQVAGAQFEMRGGELVLTEGDVRASLTKTNVGVSLGRPLQGRSFQFTDGCRF